eukprot:27435-Prorocentrum_minimum.AAC.1
MYEPKEEEYPALSDGSRVVAVRAPQRAAGTWGPTARRPSRCRDRFFWGWLATSSSMCVTLSPLAAPPGRHLFHRRSLGGDPARRDVLHPGGQVQQQRHRVGGGGGDEQERDAGLGPKHAAECDYSLHRPGHRHQGVRGGLQHGFPVHVRRVLAHGHGDGRVGGHGSGRGGQGVRVRAHLVQSERYGDIDSIAAVSDTVHVYNAPSRHRAI